MTAVIITIHVLACLVLILVVLLQAGKGADMGATLGGSGSSAMFGSSTAANPLARITTITAITFMTTSLMLAVVSARQASVFDNTPEPLASQPAAESSASPEGGAASPVAIPATGEPTSPQPPSAQADAIPAAPPSAAPAAPAPAAALPTQPLANTATPPSGNAVPVDQAPGAP